MVDKIIITNIIILKNKYLATVWIIAYRLQE